VVSSGFKPVPFPAAPRHIPTTPEPLDFDCAPFEVIDPR
jgi:hypothetical protein